MDSVKVGFGPIDYKHLISHKDLWLLVEIIERLPSPRKDNLLRMLFGFALDHHPKQTAAAAWLGVSPRVLTYHKQGLQGRA